MSIRGCRREWNGEAAGLISRDGRIGAQALGIQSATQVHHSLESVRGQVHRHVQAADSVAAIQQDLMVRIEGLASLGDPSDRKQLHSGKVAQGVFFGFPHIDQTGRIPPNEPFAQLFRSQIADGFVSHRTPAGGWE
jgi:hypothetical protein